MSAPKLAGVREPGLRRAGAQTGGTGGGGGGSSDAVDVAISDAGNHFGATNVEGALAEVAVAAAGAGTLAANLASGVSGKGASLIHVENAANWLGVGSEDLESFLASSFAVLDAVDQNAQAAQASAAAAGASATSALAAAAAAAAAGVTNAAAIVVNAAAVALRTKISDLISTAGGLGAALVGFNNGGSVVPPIFGATIQDAVAYLAAKVIPILQGGTGQTTAAASFDALTVTAAAITCAATIDLSLTGCPGHYVVINGNTGPVTSLGIAPAGTERIMRFASTPTLVHDATALILPGAANIVAAAGDVMFVHSLGAGNWRCTSYMRAASMAALVADLASVAAAKGASTIGIQDAAALIVATNVEAALAELAAKPLLEYYATNAAVATSLTLSGLNGDADGDYLVDIEIRSAVGSNTFKIQVNGADTNLDWFTYNGLVGGSITAGNWNIGQIGGISTWSSGDLICFQGRIRARSGRIRIFTANGYAIKGGSVTGLLEMGRYNDTTTNLTSISIVASVASGLSAGSFIRMTRLPTTNPLA